MIQRRHILVASVGAALVSGLQTAQAQSGKPVRIVVPFAAGGVQDILARSLSAELGIALGQTVIVENKAGAGGTIGTAAVARGDADGTSMVMAAASHNIVGTLYNKLPYDPQKDFAPLAHIGTASYVLMIHPDVPAKNAAEFIRYAKANPGKLNYATAGVGSATHLSMAYFNSMAGIDIVHVPLKATGEAINEVISGRAHAVIAANIGALAFAKDSRIRLLGVTSPKRSKFLPDLPTMNEAGVPNVSMDIWWGIVAKSGTSSEDTAALSKALREAIDSDELKTRFASLGIYLQSSTPAELGAIFSAEIPRLGKVVRDSGASVD